MSVEQKMNNLRDGTVSLIIKKPLTCLLLFLTLFAVIAPGVLKVKQQFGYKIWYNDKDPLMELFRVFEGKFGNDDMGSIAVYTEDGIFNKKTLTAIVELTDAMGDVSDMVRVDSLSNYSYIFSNNDEINVQPFIDVDELSSYDDKKIKELRKLYLEDPNLKGLVVDEKETMTLVNAFVRPSYQGDVPDYSGITQELYDLAEEFRKKYPEIQFLVTGTVVLTDEFKRVTFDDLKLLLPLVHGLFILILIFIYRRRSGVLLPYAIIISCILMMTGINGYIGFNINSLSSAGPTILLTVAIADAIHIMTVYFWGIKNNYSSMDAVRYSLTKNFYPTMLTSITTAIGFFSFAPALVRPVSELGISVGCGVIFAWLATYFLVGPLLCFMPKMSKKTRALEKSNITEAVGTVVPSKFTLTNIDRIYRYRYLIVLITFCLFFGSLYVATGLEVNMDPFDQFGKKNAYVQRINKIEEKFGAIATMHMMVDCDGADCAKEPKFLKEVEKFENWIVTLPEVERTFSINNIIKNINRVLNNNDMKNFVIPDSKEAVGQELFFYTLDLPPGREINNRINLQNDSIRVTAQWNVKDSVSANNVMTAVRKKAKEMNLDLKITGKMPLFHQLTPYVVSTFADSFLIAFISITIILIIVLKSFKIGLLALVPNLFPLATGAAIYYFSGAYVDMATVIVASVCLGIAVDDSIHFLFEYQKYRAQGKNIKDTFGVIFTNTFPALFFTTLIICIGFGSFVIAEYQPNAKFGITTAGVLLIALIADFIALPALLFITERDS